MTNGVLAVANAVTGMSPHKVPETNVMPVAETQAEPSQYSSTELADARVVPRQTWAVPEVSPRIDRS